MERAKECRRIKREQKGHRRRSLSLSSPLLLSSSLSVSREPLFSCRPSSSRAGSSETDVFVFNLSQLFLIHLSSFLTSSVSFPLRRRVRDFSSHTAYPPRPFNQALPGIRSATLSLSRSEDKEDDSENEKEKEIREAQTFSECGPRESVSIVRYLCFITFN